MRDEAPMRNLQSEAKIRKANTTEKLTLTLQASSIVRSLSARISRGKSPLPSPSPSPSRAGEPPKIVETKSVSDLSGVANGAALRVRASASANVSGHASPIEIVLPCATEEWEATASNADSASAHSDEREWHSDGTKDSSCLQSRSHSVKVSKSNISISLGPDPEPGPNKPGVFYNALTIANRCNRTASTRVNRLGERLPRAAGTFCSQKAIAQSGFLSPPCMSEQPIRSASIADCTGRSPTVEFLPIYSELRRDKRLDDEIEGAWRRFDLDGDGSISMRELASVMNQLGQTPSEDELRQMIEQVDEDGDGRIGWQEFSKMMDSQFDELDKQEQKMRRAFEYFDLKKDQFIDKDELHTALNRLGDKLTLDEAEEMIRAADSDCDGMVSYAEFVAMMSSHLAHALGE